MNPWYPILFLLGVGLLALAIAGFGVYVSNYDLKNSEPYVAEQSALDDFDRLLDTEAAPMVIKIPEVSSPWYFRYLRGFRLGRWVIARRLGLRCLICNRRAGYGGRCPREEHNV